MKTRPLSRHCFSLILFWALLSGGCAAIPVSGESPVVVQSYDLPDSLEVNTVIHAVELAFTHTLGTTPWIVEGSVPSPLPSRPAPFTVGERRVHFERLGVATIHEVGCPGSLASVHAWKSDRSESSTLHRYTGCIQLYAGAYRVQLIDSRLILKRSHGLTESAETRPKSYPNLLPRLAQAFIEQVTEAREVTSSDTGELFASHRQVHEKTIMVPDPSDRELASFVPMLPEDSEAGSSMRNLVLDAVTTFPLVCLAPRHETAVVRKQIGAGQVIQVLEKGSLTVGAESVESAHFHVKTAEGLEGWVNRSDVRRLPCPIG